MDDWNIGRKWEETKGNIVQSEISEEYAKKLGEIHGRMEKLKSSEHSVKCDANEMTDKFLSKIKEEGIDENVF